MGKTDRRSSVGTWMGKSTELGILFIGNKDYSCRYTCMHDIEMVGKKQNISLMWKKLMKNVDLVQTTSFWMLST